MVKYTNSMVTFREFPDEISLCIDISGCPNHCKGCHSPWLWEDTGTELTIEELDRLIQANDGISCIGFMGGDQDPEYINNLAKHVKANYSIKTGWYSGKHDLSTKMDWSLWDYIKLGPYIEEKGGLDNPNTNQRMYCFTPKNIHSWPKDITYKFWKNDSNS